MRAACEGEEWCVPLITHVFRLEIEVGHHRC